MMAERGRKQGKGEVELGGVTHRDLRIFLANVLTLSNLADEGQHSRQQTVLSNNGSFSFIYININMDRDVYKKENVRTKPSLDITEAPPESNGEKEAETKMRRKRKRKNREKKK